MISVCIASFNGEKFIKQQLNSILSQLGVDDEIIISDDFSSDGTVAVVNQIADDRIKVYYNYNQSGFVGNFENAISKSNGEFIFLADQDDIWFGEKILVVKDLLYKYDLIVHNAILTDEFESVILESYFTVLNSGPGFLKNLYKNSYIGCCMAFRRCLLNHILPFPSGLIAHDIWIGYIAYFVGKVKFTKINLIYYRRHPGAVTDSGMLNSNKLIYKIKFRIHFFILIIIRFLKIMISRIGLIL